MAQVLGMTITRNGKIRTYTAKIASDATFTITDCCKQKVVFSSKTDEPPRDTFISEAYARVINHLARAGNVYIKTAAECSLSDKRIES